MGFRCGLVGLPNVGKSTLFNALTGSAIAAENYPFCTIDPNVGNVAVPDQRLQALSTIVRPQRIVPTYLSFVDIAGLVKNAAQGEGLGNQFLGHIREVDAIAHIVRCFVDDNVTHVEGGVAPLRDIDIINTELLLADIATVDKAIARTEKAIKGDRKLTAYLDILSALHVHLNEGNAARLFSREADMLADLHLLTDKPQFFIANVDEAHLHDNSIDEQLRNGVGDAAVVRLCAALEAEIAALDEDDKAAFLADYGLREPGLAQCVRVGYQLLGLKTFFTAGEKEVRAWTVHAHATAPQAAGCIHSDMERGFIRAEVIAFDDFIACNGEVNAKSKGLLRLEGKEYVLAEGDVCHFRFNV